jgi:hypothetical protein
MFLGRTFVAWFTKLSSLTPGFPTPQAQLVSDSVGMTLPLPALILLVAFTAVIFAGGANLSFSADAAQPRTTPSSAKSLRISIDPLGARSTGIPPLFLRRVFAAVNANLLRDSGVIPVPVIGASFLDSLESHMDNYNLFVAGFKSNFPLYQRGSEEVVHVLPNPYISSA